MRSSSMIWFSATVAILVGCGFSPKMRGTEGAGGSTGTSTGTGTAGGSGGQIIITGQGGSVAPTGSAGNDGTSTLDANCGAKDKPAMRLPPDILLVYDASGSMNQDIMNMTCQGGCGATSKWALMAPAVNQVVMATEADVNWGLKFFASNNDCTVNANANVTVGPTRAAMVAAAIAGRTDANGNVTNGSRTPTRAGVSQGAAYLMTVQDSNPKYIVLVTDGLPNCPMTGNTADDDTAGAVAAITASAAAGFPVFVVGVATAGLTTMGGVNADQVLTMFANAGGRPRMGGQAYYSASNAAELSSALTTLISTVNSCTFMIGPAPTTDGTTSLGFINVFGDGVEIPRDTSHTNGWDYVAGSNMGSIQVYGPTCDAVVATTIQNVTVTFRCIFG